MQNEDHASGPGADSNIRALPSEPKPPTEAEIAADLKKRLEEALKPVCAIFDEAAQHKLAVQWDAIAPQLHLGFKHWPNNLRLVRTVTYT